MAQDIIEAQTTLPHMAGFEVVTPLSSRTLFWRPRFLRDSPALQHVPFLFWLTDTLRPASFVTLGGGDGVAHFALCQAVDKLDLDSRGYGFGPWAGAGAGAGVPADLRAHNDEAYPDLSLLSDLDPAAAAATFARGTADLILLRLDTARADAHDRDLLLRDALERDWLHRMSDRGVLLIQGITPALARGAIADFLGQLAETHPTFRFETGDGMLLVLQGRHPPERLARLCALGIGTAGYGAVLQVFGRLGGAVRNETALRTETSRVADLDRRLTAAETRLAETLAEAGMVRADLDLAYQAHDDRTRQIATLQGRVIDPQDEVAALVAALAAARAESVALRADQSLADSLNARIATLETERDSAAEKLAWLRKERERLIALVEQTEAQRNQAEAAAADRSATEAALAEAEARHAEALGEAEARHATVLAEAEAAHGADLAHLTGATAQATAEAAARQEGLLRQGRILAAERDALEADLAAARSAAAALSQRLADQAAAVTSREADLQVTTAARAAAFETDLRALTARLEADRDAADADRAATRAERDAAQTAATEAAARLALQQGDLETLRARLQQLQEATAGTSAGTSAGAEAAAAEITALRAARDAAERRADQARVLAEKEVANQQAQLRYRLARFESLAVTDRDTIAVLRAEMRALQGRVEQILSSTSWRMTGPLRKMIQTLRRS